MPRTRSRIGSNASSSRDCWDCRYTRDAGASPLFPPHHPNAQAAQAHLRETLHQHPPHFGLTGSRWNLSSLAQACPFLASLTPSGRWRLLERLHLSYKRGRGHLHSPDPDYVAKLLAILEAIGHSQAQPERWVTLFADEMGLYRQPTLASDWEEKGPQQPLAELGLRTNACVRIAGALNVLSGQVSWWMGSKLRLSTLVAFFEAIRADYPQAEEIRLVVDNWPVHFHPDVLAALMPQQIGFPVPTPGNWPQEASAKARRLGLPIRLLPLPTYAPWTNPIEKLWRLLRQTHGHLHRFGDHWQAFQQQIRQFLEEFAQGSVELLRYVGLSQLDTLYQGIKPARSSTMNGRY